MEQRGRPDRVVRRRRPGTRRSLARIDVWCRHSAGLAVVAAAGWFGLMPASDVLAEEAVPEGPAALDQAGIVIPPRPTLELFPAAGPPGQAVVVDGAGWPVSAEPEATALWGPNGEPMTSSGLTVDQGELSGTVTIPADATPGHEETIVVCVELGDEEDEDDVDIIIAPRRWCMRTTFSVEPELFADPVDGRRGTVVDLSGRWADSAAGKDSSATVVWQPTDELLGNAVIAPDGTITAKVIVPLGAAVAVGGIAVCPERTVAPRQCVVTAFGVLGPTLVPDPAKIRPGNDVRLTGTGWCCPNDDVTVVNVSAGDRWGTGVVDEAGNLTAEAEVPLDAVDGNVELVVCSGDDCRSTAVSVIVPPTTTTTTTPPSTSDPSTTPPPETTDSPTTAPATTGGPQTTDLTTTVPDGDDRDDDDDEREQAIVAGLVSGGGAGLVAGALLWRRFSSRRRAPRIAARVVPRPDAGRQSVVGHGGPAITVSAVLDIGHRKPVLHFRRRS